MHPLPRLAKTAIVKPYFLVGFGNKPDPPNNVFVDRSDSGLDMDSLATISDLEAWSSSLILEPDNPLAHPDNITLDHRGLREGLDFPA